MTSTAPTLEAAFTGERAFLRALLYRMTGCLADADDLVQDTFVRALERPPIERERAWRPWLTRVALNLGRDLLRRRKRRGYVGPWLPSPVPTGEHGEPPSFDPPDLQPGPGARYDLAESASLAFLIALEALTPAQRAVLLLRDVLDESVRETAAALDMSEANVKTTHLRARRAMATYDAERCPPSHAERARTAMALQRFLEALALGDATALEALLARDVRIHSDGGGEFVAARRIVGGRDKVVRFLFGLAAKAAQPSARFVTFNGLPGVVLTSTGPTSPGWARRSVFQVALDRHGLVRDVWGVLASRKLTAL